MDTCPNCKRKLLSHASIRCNWCGAEINDESYQQQAAEERANFRAHEAQRDAIEAARAAGGSFNMNIWGNPIGQMSPLANTWAGRKRLEQAKFQAQQRAMQEYAAAQQANPTPAQPPFQDTTAPPQAQPAANPVGEEETPSPENEVRSMFRHLEL